MIEFSEHMVGRYYKIILVDDSVIEGKCISYIPDKDNVPEIDSLWITCGSKTIEVYLNEVKNLQTV